MYYVYSLSMFAMGRVCVCIYKTDTLYISIAMTLI